MVYHFAMDFGVICENAEKNGGPRHDQIGLSEPVQLKFAADRLTDRFLRGRSAGSCGKNKVVSWHKSSPQDYPNTQKTLSSSHI